MSLIVDIEKKIGNFHLKANFTSESGTLAILGASGCGKTMTLKCIAGIETPDSGKVVLNGKVLFDSSRRINLPSRLRRTGYLFQNYALFPNMTVEQNIAVGIPENRDKKDVTRRKIAAFYLNGLEKQYPSQLSGGQQQRVALARLLANEPLLLMFDEPFSALDSYLKWQLEQEIMEVRDSFPGPVLFVSHNRDEVYRLCDRVVVMDNGETLQPMSKHDLFANPQTLTAALLSGCKNVSKAKRTGKYSLFAEDWNTELITSDPVPETLQHIGYRAHLFTPADQDESVNVIETTIERIINDMFSIILILRLANGNVLRYETEKSEGHQLNESDKLRLKINMEDLILMKKS